MVIDTSALVAFMLDEDDADRFEAAIVASPNSIMSLANILEASLVLSRYAPETDMILDPTLERLGIRPISVTMEQVRLARWGHSQFGRGSGHPAKLNFGDCFAYALAKSLDAPLLFKGGDFAQTDVKAA